MTKFSNTMGKFSLQLLGYLINFCNKFSEYIGKFWSCDNQPLPGPLSTTCFTKKRPGNEVVDFRPHTHFLDCTHFLIQGHSSLSLRIKESPMILFNVDSNIGSRQRAGQEATCRKNRVCKSSKLIFILILNTFFSSFDGCKGVEYF